MAVFNPAFNYVNGEGRPVFLVTKSTPFWSSFGVTTYTATTVVEADSGTSYTISSSNAAGDYVQTTISHTILLDQRVIIAGHSGATPDINGKHQVHNIPAANQITIPVDITVGGTGGTVKRTPDFTKIWGGMKISSTVGTPAEPTWARILDVDDDTNTITIDPEFGWSNGVPSNGTAYTVDGYFIALPYCKTLVERFEPEQLIHNKFRGKKEVLFYGWNYAARLDYSSWISADDLYLFDDLFNIDETDSVVLVPRIDAPGYNYNVHWTGSSEIARYGLSPGHRGFVVNAKGKELTEWPINTDGYGFDYATVYGTTL